MAKNVQLTIDIKGNDSVGKAAEKTKSLRQELVKLKDQIAKGVFSGQELLEAEQKAGQLQKSLKSVNDQVNQLAKDNGKLNAFVELGQGIVGGFAAAQGAMALFGEENKDLEKTLVKLQASIALMNGLEQVSKTLKKESAILTELQSAKLKVLTFVQGRYAAVVGTTTGAMKLLRLAGAAIPITLLITGIGILIANFDKIKKVVLGFLPDLSKLGDLFTKVKNAVMDFVGISSEAERAIDAQAKANEKSSKQIDRQIALLEAQGGKEREIFDLRYKQLRQDADLLEMKKKKKLASQEEIDQLDDLRNAILVLNQEETNRQNEIVKNEQKKNEEVAKKRKEAHDKRVEQEKKDAEELRKLISDETEKQRERDFSEQAKEIDALQDAAEEKMKIAKGNAEAEKLILDNLSKDVAAIREKYRLEAEAKQKEIDDKKTEDDKAKNEQRLADEKAYAEQTIAVTQAIEDSKISIAQQGAQLLNQVAGQSKGLALAALAIEKGAAIASVIINTQRAIAGYTAAAAQRSALTAGATTAFDTALAAKQIAGAKISAGINIASIAAAGINGARNISSGGGSGGGGSVQPPNIRGSQTTNEQPTPQPTKVFVTETDIRSVTRKVDGIFTQATII